MKIETILLICRSLLDFSKKKDVVTEFMSKDISDKIELLEANKQLVKDNYK
jgi:hypothetical protein